MSSILTISRFFRLLFLFLLFGNHLAFSQSDNNSEAVHEITIYAMPTLYPLNWDNPATLYNSMKDCYFKTVLESDNYLLGHIAVSVNSPILPKPLIIAMTSADAQEKVNLVLKQKIGFGILGATLKGRIEREDELLHKFEIYSKRKKLAFITYRINEKAVRRILSFIDTYTRKNAAGTAPCNFYGGAFWPRYHNEGSGCWAFGMALLSTANLLTAESEDWRIKVKIPINVIGGEYNHNKKIKYSLIRKTDEWYTGNGVENIDYVNNSVYDPSVIFNWIINQRNATTLNMKPIEKDGVPGLLFDGRNILISENDPLFQERKNPDLFIKRFQMKTNTANLNN